MDGDVETLRLGADSLPLPRQLRRQWGRAGRGRRPGPAAIAALVLIVALVGGALTWWALSDSGPAPPAVSPRLAALGAKDVRSATAVITAAGTTMSLGMTDIHGVPTVAMVSAVVDPYVSALQHYERVLTGATLTLSALPARRSVLDHVHHLVTFLQTLTRVPADHLGSWIDGFYLQTAELQAAIDGLQNALSTTGTT
jgi:hypothetical protein